MKFIQESKNHTATFIVAIKHDMCTSAAGNTQGCNIGV